MRLMSMIMYSTVVLDSSYAPKLPIEILLSEVAARSVHILSDVSKTSGLGGSGSCFAAGLKALYPQLDKMQIAQMGLYLEQKVMKNTSGNQDHYCAAFGGFMFLVSEDNKVDTNQLVVPALLPRLLLLVYAGDRQCAGSDIIQRQMSCTKALHHQKQLAKAMRDSITDYNQFGKLLNEVWETKKSCSSLVTTPEIDDLYQRCLGMGAIGGCLMVAGGGGYMLFMEGPENEGELRANLTDVGITYSNIEIDTEGVRLLE